MALVEDFTAFMADFAIEVTLDGGQVRAIFDNGASLNRVGDAGMANTQPMLTLPTADVPASVVGASAVVSSTAYVVAAHEPDGTGMSTLLLELA